MHRRQYIYALVWPSGRSTGITYFDAEQAYLAAREIGATVRRKVNPAWRDAYPTRAWAA
jgi:hypothetical protein